MNRIVEPGNLLASAWDVSETATRLSVQPVILAGGSGTQSRPLSRERKAKPLPGFMSELMQDEPVLETTLSWLDASFAAAEHAAPASGTRSIAAPLVFCSEDVRLPAPGRLEFERSGRPVRLVFEPMSRNTAPALTVAALAARAAAAAGDDPLIVALPANPLIADHIALGAALAEALEYAARGAIVALGVPPRRAETGCGYIRTGTPLGEQGARAIERFVEKPDPELAERYAAAGNYWWDSGMFVVRASVWLAAIELCRPAIAEACAAALEHATVDGGGALHLSRDALALCPSDSIDYAVMERVGSDARLVGVAVPLVAGRPDADRWDSLWTASAKADSGNVMRAGERFMLAPTQSVDHPPGVADRLDNPGETPLELVEVQSAGYPGDEDLVRFEDPYCRNLESGHAGKRTLR
jgi:mannose-1-phosphate guanylyltransferase / mannose-6-phosphate isomerase